MDVFAIGDENTVLGMRLAGVEGEVVESTRQAEECLDRALEQEGIGLILITSPAADPIRERINHIRMQQVRPVIIEIPGSDLKPPLESVYDLIKRAVGVSV